MKLQLPKKRQLRLLMCCVFAALPGLANDAVTPAIGFDNVHIRVSDPAKAVEWYVKYFGGTSPGPRQVYIGKALIQVVKTTNPKPSAGSVIDHFGLSFADLDAKMTERCQRSQNCFGAARRSRHVPFCVYRRSLGRENPISAGSGVARIPSRLPQCQRSRDDPPLVSGNVWRRMREVEWSGRWASLW